MAYDVGQFGLYELIMSCFSGANIEESVSPGGDGHGNIRAPDRSERTSRHAGLAAQAALRVDHRQVAALDLDDGARLTCQASLAFGAGVACLQINVKDWAHHIVFYLRLITEQQV